MLGFVIQFVEQKSWIKELITHNSFFKKFKLSTPIVNFPSAWFSGHVIQRVMQQVKRISCQMTQIE